MVSAIDPTKPSDGVPAVKADLRRNLVAAKVEIESLQQEVESLREAAQNANGGSFFSVKDFGAAGNGSTDDTAAIQHAIDNASSDGAIIFFPCGKYRITSTLIIPNTGVAGILKPVIFLGEGGGGDGNAGGPAGGTALVADISGAGSVAVDASDGGTGGLQPVWRGGLDQIALHNGNSCEIGLLCNSLRGGIFRNCTLRSFSTNLRVRGQVFYNTFERLMSYRGQARFEDIINHPAFYACHFSKYNGANGAACHIGNGTWLGSGVTFRDCYFEQNDKAGLYCQMMTTLLLDRCYFEGNGRKLEGDGDVEYHAQTSNRSILIARGSHHRLVNNGHKCYRFEQSGRSNARAMIDLQDIIVGAEGTRHHVLEVISDASADTRFRAHFVGIEAGTEEANCPLTNVPLSSFGDTNFWGNWATEPT